jgi:hypothetical protein
MENMSNADEYRHLQELYADMSDSRLDAMADDIDDLTEIAQQVLRAEISKRGLDAQAKDPSEKPIDIVRHALSVELSERGLDSVDLDTPEAPGEGPESKGFRDTMDPWVRDPVAEGLDPNAYDLIGVWIVADASEAREVMGVLDSAGIKSYLGPENVESVDDYKGSYIDGVRIKVMKFQYKYAWKGLNLRFPPKPEEEAAADAGNAICCPRCNSQDVIFQGLVEEPGEDSAADAKNSWACDACGHQWKDDGIEEKV